MRSLKDTEGELATMEETSMRTYFPIDQRMNRKDVAGATVAYPNEDNTGWLFRHCDQDYMSDHEAKLVAALTDAFAPMHRQLANRVMQLLVDNIVDRFKDAAIAKVHLMEQFHTETELLLRKWARSLYLGYYHQNEHDSHIHLPISTAIKANANAWKVIPTKLTKLQTIADEVADVLSRAATLHEYETRWDQEVRIAAEKKAAAAAGVDTVDGFEFCYTQVLSNAAITGDANLPDPDWDFDQLKDGPIDRGAYRYTDSETAPNAFLFVAIRFKRPIPEGTQPGADIGNVPWEQEAPYIQSVASQ